MSPEIKLNAKARIRYGEHAGKYATVVGIAECGHHSHDQIALFIHDYDNPTPIYVFRFACEAITTPSMYIDRIRRFDRFDEVIVTAPARAEFSKRGRITEVSDLPVLIDSTGRCTGPFHARYEVEFGWNGFDAPHAPETAVLYDWELKLASEK